MDGLRDRAFRLIDEVLGANSEVLSLSGLMKLCLAEADRVEAVEKKQEVQRKAEQAKQEAAAKAEAKAAAKAQVLGLQNAKALAERASMLLPVLLPLMRDGTGRAVGLWKLNIVDGHHSLAQNRLVVTLRRRLMHRKLAKWRQCAWQRRWKRREIEAAKWKDAAKLEMKRMLAIVKHNNGRPGAVERITGMSG